MAPAGSPFGAFLAIAMPLMMIVTALRALISAAGRADGRGRVTTPAVLLVIMGALSASVGFWWQDIVLSKPASSDAWGAGLLPFIAADFALWIALWSALAFGIIRIARHRAQKR